MNSMGVVGTLHDLGNGTGMVRMEDVFDTDIDDLWSALTDPSRLSRWLAVVSGDLRLGGTIHARFTSTWDGAGRIDICDAPRRLLATMEPGTPDETIIEAVLTAEGGKTRLVIEERGLPLDDLPGHGAGWQAHVEDLATYLGGNEPGDWKARWTALTPSYRDLIMDLS
jgi:uncharacterized protein YndB with AHSA1/START domain